MTFSKNSNATTKERMKSNVTHFTIHILYPVFGLNFELTIIKGKFSNFITILFKFFWWFFSLFLINGNKKLKVQLQTMSGKRKGG